MLWLLGVLFLVIAVISYKKQEKIFSLTYITYFFHAFSLLILAVFDGGKFKFASMFRYFIYIASSFLMVFLPFVLIIVSILILTRLKGASKKWLWYDVVSIIVTFVFVLVTVYLIFNRRSYDLTPLLRVYMTISLYFTSSILTFVLLIIISKYSKKKDSYDYIIVLGAKLGEDGRVLEVLRRRLDLAVTYYKKQVLKPKIIVTGGISDGDVVSEASMMKKYLIEEGVNSSDIIEESASRSTRENLINSKELVGVSSINSSLLITSSTHLPRSCNYAARVNLPVDLAGSSEPFYLLPYSFVREYVAFMLSIRRSSSLLLLVLMFIN